MALKQTCKKCHKKIFIDFGVTDELWAKLPREWQNNALCFDCFLELLEKTNPDISLNINDFTWIGIYGDLDNEGEMLNPNMRIDFINSESLPFEKETIKELEKWEGADEELAHGKADDALIDLLKKLGYTNVVQAWTKIDKWFS